MLNRDEIKKAYDLAPAHLKELVDSDEVLNAFHEIRKKHNLHLDHAENLALAIDMVVLEMAPFGSLKNLLEEGLRNIDEASRNEIIKDVDALIFKPLREKTREQATQPVPPRKEERSSIRDVELKIRAEVPPIVPPVPEPAAPALVSPSVIEQKLGATPPSTATTTPITQPAPKYHGTDPYREMPE